MESKFFFLSWLNWISSPKWWKRLPENITSWGRVLGRSSPDYQHAQAEYDPLDAAKPETFSLEWFSLGMLPVQKILIREIFCRTKKSIEKFSCQASKADAFGGVERDDFFADPKMNGSFSPHFFYFFSLSPLWSQSNPTLTWVSAPLLEYYLVVEGTRYHLTNQWWCLWSLFTGRGKTQTILHSGGITCLQTYSFLATF